MDDRSCHRYFEELSKVRGFLDERSLEQRINNLSPAGLEKINSSIAALEAVLGKAEKEAVTIRPYRSGELGYIAYRHSVLYRLEYDLGDIFEFYLIQGMSRFLDEGGGKGEVWVVDYKGSVQGSIAIVETEPGSAQLRWFLIEPEFRGLNLGKKLMETCIDYCSRKNYHKIYLWTFDELDAARHLYERYGFRVTEKKTHSPWGREITEERWDLELG